MLSAFINNTCTRLDTADLSMWRSAGLKLTFDGFVMPSHPQFIRHGDEGGMCDDVCESIFPADTAQTERQYEDQALLLTTLQMISNSLVWILMKLVNFIAAGKRAVSINVQPMSD